MRIGMVKKLNNFSCSAKLSWQMIHAIYSRSVEESAKQLSWWLAKTDIHKKK